MALYEKSSVRVLLASKNISVTVNLVPINCSSRGKYLQQLNFSKTWSKKSKRPLPSQPGPSEVQIFIASLSWKYWSRMRKSRSRLIRKRETAWSKSSLPSIVDYSFFSWIISGSIRVRRWNKYWRQWSGSCFMKSDVPICCRPGTAKDGLDPQVHLCAFEI